MAFIRGGAVTFNVTKQAQQFRLKVVFRAKEKGKFVKSGLWHIKERLASQLLYGMRLCERVLCSNKGFCVIHFWLRRYYCYKSLRGFCRREIWQLEW
jgi:hypothetical protein